MTSPSLRTNGDRTDSTEPRPVTHRVADRLGIRSRDSSPFRPTGGGSLALLVASVAVSLLSIGLLEETMRIRWSVGTYYGPEYASTAVVLTAFPLAIAAGAAAFRALAGVLERHAPDAFDEGRAAYELSVLAFHLCLLFAQVGLVAANLW